ncbi:unnamed protein product [Ectocarpus sp. 13 AM-2016]
MRRIAPLLRGKLSMRFREGNASHASAGSNDGKPALERRTPDGEIVWRLEMTSTASLEVALAKHKRILYEVWRPARDPDAA